MRLQSGNRKRWFTSRLDRKDGPPSQSLTVRSRGRKHAFAKAVVSARLTADDVDRLKKASPYWK